jgi:zinc protease
MKHRPGVYMTRTLALPILLGAALAAAAPPPIQSQRLKNGLQVLVVEDHALPLVTVEIAVKNGAMTEPPEFNGLSHLYEHMFFKANKVIPSEEAFAARQRELGIRSNAQTADEKVNYYFTTTADHAAAAMAFIRDAALHPLFGEAELKRERVVVTGEIDRAEANPYYHFGHLVDQRVWWKYPSRKDPLGNRATVLAATPQKMRTIQHRYYVPNNSALIVVGDVKADAVFAAAQKLFGGWKQGPDPFKKYPLVKHLPIPRTEVVQVVQPVQTVTMMLEWHGPSTVGKDVDLTYAADVLGTALDEPSSKFQKALVDSGACVRAGMGWITRMNTGPIMLSLEATPEKADACVKAAMAELPKLKAPDFLSAEEMRNAALRLEVQQVLERERPSAFANSIAFWWASAGLDYYLTYVEKLRQVTHADIARYLDTYVLGKPYVFGVMVSPEMDKKGLSKSHFDALLGLPPAAPAKPEVSR